jgi:hypothetical protein
MCQQAIKLNESVEQLDKLIHEFFLKSFERPFLEQTPYDSERRRGIRAPAGIGKTTAIVNVITGRRDLQGKNIEIYVPTHDLAEQMARDILAVRDLHVIVIRGRSRDHPSGEPMCKKSKLAAKISELGLGVKSTLCGNSENDRRCEHFETCAYISQFNDEQPGVRIFAHNYIFLPRVTTLELPSLIVIDETFIQKSREEFKFPLRFLTHPRSDDPKYLAGCKKVIARSLLNGRALLRDLRIAGFSSDTIHELANIERQQIQRPSISPNQEFAVQKQRLSNSARNDGLHILFSTLEKEIDIPRDISHAIELKEEKGEQIVYINRRKKTLLPKVPTLIIDADLNEILLDLVLPRAEYFQIAASRIAQVIQLTDRTLSLRSLIAYEEASEKEVATAAAQVEKVKELIVKETIMAPERTLVVMPLKVQMAFSSNPEELTSEYEGADIRHFGQLRGLNDFETYETVIIVGRSQQNVESLESEARAYWWDDDDPLNFVNANDYGQKLLANRNREIKVRDEEPVSVNVNVHPDERIQALLELEREAETTQAIDRIRAIRAPLDKPKRILILSSVPVDITVDHPVTWDELTQLGPKWVEVLNALDGVIPLKPDWLSERFPELWPNKRLAKSDIGERGKKPDELIYIITRESGFFIHEFRVGNQRSYSRALCRKGIENVAERLEELFGKDVKIRTPAT